MDRNIDTKHFCISIIQSLSARRAWIEIRQQPAGEKQRTVALRKESVDRNDTVQVVVVVMNASLSARRAWIEILSRDSEGAYLVVALRKESVDRNSCWLLA